MKIGNPERWRKWARSLGPRIFSRRRSPLALSFVRLARLLHLANVHRTISHRHYSGGSIAVQPRIQMALNLHARLVQTYSNTVLSGVLPAAAAGNSAAAPNLTNAMPRQQFQHVAAQPERASTQRLLRDIVERTRRVEERVALRTRLAVRATSPADAQGDPKPNQSRTADEWWKSDPATSIPRQQVAPAAMSVEQITDNVLRQLDRRVGAWRERLGRS